MNRFVALCFVSLSLVVAGVSAHAVDPLEHLPSVVAKRQKVLIEDETCEADLGVSSQVIELKENVNLYLVPCIMGAYQGSSRAYILQHGNTVTEVTVLAYDELAKAIVGSLELGEVQYDSKTAILSTFTKSRGLGDCGQSSVSKIMVDQYGSVTVKTVEVRAKDKCDGKYGKWPIVFKQK